MRALGRRRLWNGIAFVGHSEMVRRILGTSHFGNLGDIFATPQMHFLVVVVEKQHPVDARENHMRRGLTIDVQYCVREQTWRRGPDSCSICRI